MNLSGILVIVKPQYVDSTIALLNALPGVEVHHRDADNGRLIVVQEATSVGAEVEGLKKIKQLPNIIVAEMVNHYFADDNEMHTSIPPELDELEGLPDMPIPSFLNK